MGDFIGRYKDIEQLGVLIGLTFLEVDRLLIAQTYLLRRDDRRGNRYAYARRVLSLAEINKVCALRLGKIVTPVPEVERNLRHVQIFIAFCSLHGDGKAGCVLSF